VSFSSELKSQAAALHGLQVVQRENLEADADGLGALAAWPVARIHRNGTGEQVKPVVAQPSRFL